jgi:maleylacetoacetate isomerase
LKLYSYYRSSAAYRVRIALNFKGLPYEMIPIHLAKEGGHHRTPEFRAINPLARAKVRAVAQTIVCDIHPLNNSGTLQYLKNILKHAQPEIDAWYHYWIIEGFNAIEAVIAPAPYTCGAQVTLADICLVPQVANARRFKVPLDAFPKIVAAEQACLKLPAFDKARPENQLDAE